MSDCVQPAPLAAPRSRSLKARREARLAKYERENLIVEYLNRGVSVPEIAAQLGVTEKRMRARIGEILARRMPAPPAQFLALQVSRLNEALLVAYSAMSGMNLRAVDRVVKIVRELDRYHGFAAAERRSRPDAPSLEAPAPLALLALMANRAELAPQRLAKMESAPGIGAAQRASNANAAAARFPETLALGLAASEQIPVAPAASHADRPETASQDPENAENAPGNGSVSEASGRDSAGAEPCEASALPLEASEDVCPAAAGPPADRPGMLPQRFEKTENAPGNGSVSEASGRDSAGAEPGEAPALPLGASEDVCPAAAGPPADRPGMLPQRFEKTENAPGNGAVSEASDRDAAGAEPGEGSALILEASERAPLAPAAPLTDTPQTAPQDLEKAENAPGIGAVSGASNPGAPAAPDAILVRRTNVRAMLNGVAAC